MASKKPTVDSIVKKTSALTLEENDDPANQLSEFYANRKESDKINFARLEKGLLLFIYVYETAKSSLSTEMALWDHRLCFYIIKDGKCGKSPEQCRREHQTPYRQSNLCAGWYVKNSCQYGASCKHSHQFEQVTKYQQFILTDTDANVYRLIRFIRNFAGHYIDDVIKDLNDQQDLYRHIVVVMVHLVHYLSRKRSDSIEHLNLFLEAITVGQLIPTENLLVELNRAYHIPEVFFDLNMDFNTYWYQRNAPTKCIDFRQLTPPLITVFNQIFVDYFKGRLKSRGAKQAWD